MQHPGAVNQKQRRIRYFVIEAFANDIFEGNPAAVCPLNSWCPDSLLQRIASRINLSETAFFVPEQGGYRLRWFTPTQEVSLCGHATLAAAFLLFRTLQRNLKELFFHSASGCLLARKQTEEYIEARLPALSASIENSPPPRLLSGLGLNPQCILRVDADPNYYAIVESEEAVCNARPHMEFLAALHPYGVALSAPGTRADFVTRYFAPSYGIPEDPVTGSICCALTPYWAKRFQKNTLRVHQLSSRGGELLCTLDPDHVFVGGRARFSTEGTMVI